MKSTSFPIVGAILISALCDFAYGFTDSSTPKAIDMVKVVPDVFHPLTKLELMDMHMTSSCSSAKKHGKNIRLPATVIRKVKALEDILPLSDPTGHDMITTVITKTTFMHRDYSRDINGKRQLVTTPTSIIFMNNNPDAYLNLDEEGMSIPIIKGSLVKFDGSKLHHTIINNGIVQLVGPFEGNRLTPVGAPADPVRSFSLIFVTIRPYYVSILTHTLCLYTCSKCKHSQP